MNSTSEIDRLKRELKTAQEKIELNELKAQITELDLRKMKKKFERN